jgi:DnaJ-class molecular chaperone
MSSNPMTPRDGDLRAHWMAEVRRWVEGRHDLDSVDVSVKALRELLSALASPQEAQPLSHQEKCHQCDGDGEVGVGVNLRNCPRCGGGGKEPAHIQHPDDRRCSCGGENCPKAAWGGCV